MPDLHFQVEGASAIRGSATPQITFAVRVANDEGDAIHSVALRVQAQIEPVRRRYSSAEQAQLKELFGEPERWSKTLHSLLWANINVPVQAFTRSTLVEIPVPCTFDFNVAVTKYIYGLENGEIPTTLLFSGTVFYAGASGMLVAQIPWDREARHRLPVRVWKEMMDLFYPNTAWIALHRDVFERLYEFKSKNGLASWEQAIEQMLRATELAEAKP